MPAAKLLRVLLALSIASTAIHYTHNLIEAGEYPPISTIGHFLAPAPDIPPFFFVTIFTDFLTGMAMLVFGLLTLRDTLPGCGSARRI